MNCSWIILLLLLCGQNRNGVCGKNDCGCREPERPAKPCNKPEPPCARPEPCGCEDSRFEPRFEQRPFGGNGSTCGCEGESN